MGDGSIPWLLVVLKPELPRAWLRDDPGPLITVGGQPYDAWGEGPIGGFFDRVYDEAGSLCGVQFTPSPQIELHHRLRESDAVRLVDEDQRILIAWESQVENPSVTPDQAFGGRLYEGAYGDLALCFDTEFLSDVELIGLRESLPQTIDAARRTPA